MKFKDLGGDILDMDNLQWKDIPSYGDLMTLESWKGCCNDGGFIDYDGWGNLSDGKKSTEIVVYPSLYMSNKEKFNKATKDFSHIVWYNK